MKQLTTILAVFFAFQLSAQFEEKAGMVAVEAEHFESQEHSEVRKWYIIDKNYVGQITPDIDSAFYHDASGRAYLELLPDTRWTHDEKLIHGENFSGEPGKVGVLNYRIYFNNPGKYYVWVRAHSTGSEDNGIHVGLDGEWPESGQRMQWCAGKHKWTWESKQRTSEKHCGVPEQIYLEVKKKGWHTISFSMREDGFEFDKFLLTQVYYNPELGIPEVNK